MDEADGTGNGDVSMQPGNHTSTWGEAHVDPAQAPTHLADWSEEVVQVHIENLLPIFKNKTEEYTKMFKENHINGTHLLDLSFDTLKEVREE